MSWKDKYVVVDTETTGLGPDARIVEIAIVGFEKGEIVSSWSTLLCPAGLDAGKPDVQKALAVNGLSVADLGHKQFPEVAYDVYGRLNKEVIVGHNLDFDKRMIRQEWGRLLPPITDKRPAPILDVCTLLCDFCLRPGVMRRNLDAACSRWTVDRGKSHRALSDAIAAGRLLHAMLNELPDDEDEFRELLDIAWRTWDAILSQR